MITKSQPSPPPPCNRRPVVLAIALALSGGAANAATINVSGGCTLVNAINNANTDTDTDGAGKCPTGAGPDTLKLIANATYTLTARNNTIAGPNGLPVVSSVITVNGNGAAIQRSSAVGTKTFRLLRINSYGNLTLNNLSLSGGKLTGEKDYGGGVSNNGTLTLNNSTVSGNGALGIYSAGSGILNGYAGILTLNNSTVSGNSATHGGGITDFGGVTTLKNSTVSGNRTVGDTGGTGGIINIGNMKLINSTVSGNSSSSPVSYGTGGISNGSNGHMTLVHSTVSDNSIGHGNVAGILNSGTMTLTNSLIANSKGGSDCYSFGYGNTAILTLLGANLIEDGTCGVPPSADPKLGPLLDNGGVTKTQALHVGSVAIDAADSALCNANDQRNVERPQPVVGNCDIGAFERMWTKPGSVVAIVNFFDTQVASGGIIGVEKFPGQKRNAVRNQLRAAGHYKSRNLNTQACSQLARTLNRIDPDGTPDSDDYVTGSSGDELTAQVNTLRTDWACN